MSLDSPDLNLLKEHPDRTTRASAREPVSVEWVLQKFGEGLERFNGRPYRPSDFNRTEARDRKQAAELLRVLREDGKVAEGDLRSCLDRILSGYLRQDEQWLNENGHPLAALTRKVLEPRGWLSDWQSMQEAIEATKRLQEERAAENAKNAAEKARRAALTPEERAAEDAERQAMTDAFLASLQKRGPARRPNYGMGRQDQLTEEDAEWLRAPETR